MKRLHHIVILTLTLLALNSCEYEFDVKSKAKPGLYMQCIAEQGGSKIYTKLRYAAPAQGNTKEIPELQNVSLKVYVDGVLQTKGQKKTPVLWAGSGDLIEVTTDGRLKPESQIDVKVQADGLPEAVSSCVIPWGYSIEEIEHRTDSIMTMKMDQFIVTLNAQPEDGEFVGLKLEKLSWTADNAYLTEILTPMMGTSTDTETEVAQISVYMSPTDGGIIDESDDRGETVVVMPASAVRNRQVTLPYIDFESMWPDDTDSEGEEKTEYVKTEYAVTAYVVDENFYRYALANYRSRSDFMAMMGLAPANFAWSNVKGGFGLCGVFRKVNQKVVE